MELQQAGWQAILDNFRSFVESSVNQQAEGNPLQPAS